MDTTNQDYGSDTDDRKEMSFRREVERQQAAFQREVDHEAQRGESK